MKLIGIKNMTQIPACLGTATFIPMLRTLDCGLKYLESIGLFFRSSPLAKKSPALPKTYFVVVTPAGFFRTYHFGQEKTPALLDLSTPAGLTFFRPLKCFPRAPKIWHQGGLGMGTRLERWMEDTRIG
jgi:hypothetical protein